MPVKFNLKQLAVVFVLFFLCLIYLLPTIVTLDPLWFLSFNERAERIILYKEGRQIILSPGSPGFEELNTAVNQAMSQITSIAHLGPSPETMVEFKSKELCVEMRYSRRVVIHSSFNFGRWNSLFIPLTGRYTDMKAVFTGLDGVYGANTPTVRNLDQVRAVVERLLP